MDLIKINDDMEPAERRKAERSNEIRRGLRELTREQMLEVLEQVALVIVIEADEVGSTEWPTDLHLADVLEKHVFPAMKER